jgi:hypothetical protein
MSIVGFRLPARIYGRYRTNLVTVVRYGSDRASGPLTKRLSNQDESTPRSRPPSCELVCDYAA